MAKFQVLFRINSKDEAIASIVTSSTLAECKNDARNARIVAEFPYSIYFGEDTQAQRALDLCKEMNEQEKVKEAINQPYKDE